MNPNEDDPKNEDNPESEIELKDTFRNDEDL